ncbi:myrosinase 1-like isoform X1 [Pieris brassicae]|nr:myrosinase 1-like isoform X1 [Pieris brassicae]
MSVSVCFIYLFLAIIRSSSDAIETDSKICFPKKFMFGVATAAYQIEGAWNVSGKGESIWDRYTHTHPERIFDHKTGDVAADSYHNFPRDVELMAQLGVQFYRFSISWPRIMPNGLTNEVNEDGIRYYNDLLEELFRNGIMPIVTMYHWDLPQSLQDLGGWTNPIIIDYFVDYARVLFEAFGDKVKMWITVNEPLSFCEDGYGGNDAPGTRSTGFEDYLCGHNVLIAHGSVYRMYQEEYVKKQKGLVGITIDFRWIEPASTSDEDQRAAEVIRQFTFGWFAHPIFSLTGDYPPIMRKRIDIISKRQHFHRSRLPVFTPEEIEIIRGSADFLGLNHYTTSLAVYSETKITPQPSFYTDMGGILKDKPDWPKSNSTWLKVVPWGFRKALNWIKYTYNNPLVLVTENGMSLEPGLQDTRRVNYIDGYLKALHTAIVKDKCNVIGYTYWSLIDNFEWTRGFSERFGLYELDYDSPNKTRTARLSAAYYGKIARTKCIPSSWYFVD